MSAGEDHIEVRSYRSVFALERRIYRIDRLRLNPGGVPVRGVVYFAVLAMALAVAGRLPLLGWPLHELPWLGRYVVAPAGLAALFAVARIDGRPFHIALVSIVRSLLAPRFTSGMRRCAPLGSRWRPPDLVVLSDCCTGRRGRLRYRGPGAVVVSVAHRRIEWKRGPLDRVLRRAHLSLELSGGPAAARAAATIVALQAGAWVEVIPDPGAR